MQLTEGELSFLNSYLLSDSQFWRINGELYRKLLKAGARYKKDSNMQKATYGEVDVPYQIAQQLRNKGFRYDRATKPLVYRYRLQYPQHNDIDMYLRLTDENCKVYRCYINIYNWAKYHNINPFIFENRILKTFNRIDPDKQFIHIIAMNHRNIPLIADRCREHNILILPLNEHITLDFLSRIKPFE
jgi:hypothetical protein